MLEQLVEQCISPNLLITQGKGGDNVSAILVVIENSNILKRYELECQRRSTIPAGKGASSSGATRGTEKIREEHIAARMAEKEAMADEIKEALRNGGRDAAKKVLQMHEQRMAERRAREDADRKGASGSVMLDGSGKDLVDDGSGVRQRGGGGRGLVDKEKQEVD